MTGNLCIATQVLKHDTTLSWLLEVQSAESIKPAVLPLKQASSQHDTRRA